MDAKEKEDLVRVWHFRSSQEKNWSYLDIHCKGGDMMIFASNIIFESGFFIFERRCTMPPQEKLPTLQFLHIPKTATSINWFLHDYFDCLPPNASSPCMKWLETVRHFFSLQ
jgi:hypothetical protein